MKPSESDLVLEPPCWGSGELPLLPIALSRVLRGVAISGVTFIGTSKKPASRGNSKKLMLLNFTEKSWVRGVKGFTWDVQQYSVVDLVIDAVDKLFAIRPDEFDVPVLSKPIDHVGGISSIPLESRTCDLLQKRSIRSAAELLVLLQGSFREIRELLGDSRAALDFVITSDSWIEKSLSGTWSFREPRTAGNLFEAGRLARLRAFRCCGLDPTISNYTAESADILARHWSVAIPKKWTLEMCGSALGLTRERVRQIVNQRQFHAAQRRWSVPDVVVVLGNEYQLRSHEIGDPEILSSPRFARSEARALLEAYGYSSEALRTSDSASMDMHEAGYRQSEIRRSAYRATERVGFASAADVVERVHAEYSKLSEDSLNDILKSIFKFPDLPHGYIYVEGPEGSYFGNDVVRLLGLRGRLAFEELYLAATRFYRVRVPGYVLPPRSVIRTFLERDERFWLEDESVDLAEPKPHKLSGVQLWVEERIRESVGCVVHRTVLWDAARRDGISRGTLAIYFGYSMYNKPIGRGCLTLTGLYPSEDAIDIAVSKASLIRVPPRLLNWSVEDGIVIVDLELGTETVDNGLFTPPVALRRLLQPTSFRVINDGSQRGNASWSGITLYGLSPGLSARGSTPGDCLRLRFDAANGEVELCDYTEALPQQD